MRILMIALPVLMLGACNVSKDEANNTVSVTYNEEVAANTAADVTNTAQNIASDIGNEAKSTADKVNNSDISVKVNRDVKTENTAENKQ
ncbi:MAG TPA: hypothetical protein VNB78_01365 [Sphingomicrobium sp.]|jgi:hypothetical protein|nr:hypothetical protein [Sphingomicrobium sp.]